MAETADYNLLEIRKENKNGWFYLMSRNTAKKNHNWNNNNNNNNNKKEQDWGFSHDVTETIDPPDTFMM